MLVGNSGADIAMPQDLHDLFECGDGRKLGGYAVPGRIDHRARQSSSFAGCPEYLPDAYDVAGH
jgi:hypothetical protein